MIVKTIQSTRIHQWWRPKAGYLIALLLFATYIGKPDFSHFGILLFLSVCTLSGIAIFGHLTNDWGDSKLDASVGKSNSLNSLGPVKFSFVLLASIALSLIPWIWLPSTSLTFVLLGSEFLLFLIYALKPIRLKRFPIIAVGVDSLYAFTLPSILAFYTYSLSFSFSINYVLIVLLGLWNFAIGIRQVIYHHHSDQEFDKAANFPNLAVRFGSFRLNQAIRRFILPIELITGFTFLFMVTEWTSWSVLFPIVFLIFSGILSSILKLNWFANHTLGKFDTDHFYSFWWSATSLAFLLFFNSKYWLVLAIVLILFSESAGSLGLAFLSNLLAKLKSTASFLVNHGIYHFRRIFLNWSEEKNRGKYYEPWLKGKTDEQNGIIAICNSNLNKYTETFVYGHISQLPFQLEYYYGANQMEYHFRDGYLIDLEPFWRKAKLALYRDNDNFVIQKAASSMQSKNVQLILAEFGTNGTKATQISRITGIPIICIFYGYDAWHKPTLDNLNEAYQELFKQASLLLGVSQDICTQLEKLGCPKEKIQYLPCYVNFDRFTQSKHSQNNPIFLSIGRFAETKSPHLTILAFKEVLKEIPDAQLVMIGKDGGGELFEACHILVSALKIEDKVVFKGILSPDEVKTEMDNARVFVQHSLTTPLNGDKEGTPVAIMEAMSNGMAIVATKHAGIQEMIQNGENGVLVDEYDHLTMAKEMIRVCIDDGLVESLGEQAAKSIRLNPLVAGHINLLSELIKKHKIS